MNRFFNHLVRKPTFVSVMTALYFAYIVFLVVYKWFDPPKTGSAYKMILEMLMISGIVPLWLFVFDRFLVLKFSNIKLSIIEASIFAGFLLYILIQ